jgi:hypothetical protein
VVSTAQPAHSNVPCPRTVCRFDLCNLAVCRPDGATTAGGDTSEVVLPADAEVPALCIELVGNRFLRRMVRILTVKTHFIHPYTII